MELKVLQDEQPWYQEGLEFTCTGCGNCCTGGPGYVWIGEQEIERLAAFLKLPVRETLKKYCRRIAGRISLKECRNPRNEYDCIFLREEKVQPSPDAQQVVHGKRICTIYPVRPLQCRTWPFWEGLLTSRESWGHAARRCPGMNRGRKYSRQEIEALRDAKDWPTPLS